MANTTADKLALLEATKANLKAALAEKGQTVGDVFSTYPAAVRAIETGGGTGEYIQVHFNYSMGSYLTAPAYIVYTGVDGTDFVVLGLGTYVFTFSAEVGTEIIVCASSGYNRGYPTITFATNQVAGLDAEVTDRSTKENRYKISVSRCLIKSMPTDPSEVLYCSVAGEPM